MGLPFFIARRYLFAGKSHNVINIVSAISAVGMAVGTAALIIILSVYNGFDAIVKTMFSTVEPDLLVVPSTGKHFTAQGEAFDWAYDNPDVKSMTSVLQENVYVSYDGRQGTALVKGVDDIYMEESALDACLTDGSFILRRQGDMRDFAAVGRGFARGMGMNIRFVSPLTLYFPDKTARFSPLNPMSAVNSRNVWPSCEFMLNSQIDNNLVIVSRGVLSQLLGLDDEVSAVEIRFADNLPSRRARALQKELERRLGPDFKVLDRARQNPSLYKMLRYEKLAVYMIMLFVVLILGFCIFGSLKMLIIDKEGDIGILYAMGMDRGRIRRIFTLEGWLITLSGMSAGAVVGVILCALQQSFGIIGMPSDFLVDSYPVMLRWSDVLISVCGISLIGYMIARNCSKQVLG